MTAKTRIRDGYAEKVWLDANAAWDSSHGPDQRKRAVAIISAALRKQREECTNKAWEVYKDAPEVWTWIREAILGAEIYVEVPR